MKYIKKENSPLDFEEYKKLDGACYDDLPKEVKNNLRKQLYQEQGGLCCYCMERLIDGRTTIEHLKPKDKNKYPELQLAYTNLLLSCDGGKYEHTLHDRRVNQLYPLHCDAQKGSKEIDVFPLDEDCETHFVYGDEGEIFGNDDRAERTIKTLNLDIPYLRNKRKQAFAAYEELKLSEEGWNEEIEALKARDTQGNFSPFCAAIVAYIENYKL